MSEDILANLVTELELQDVYSQIIDNDGSESVVEVGESFDDIIVLVAVSTDPWLVPLLPLWKQKQRTHQEASNFTRVFRDAKQCALEKAVLPTQTKEVLPGGITSHSQSPITGGKITADDTTPYIRWLELIDQH